MDWGLTQAGLVLEGGGQRGVFTAGVLRAFTDFGLYLSDIYGVSMGACNGANYVSRQKERNRIVITRYAGDSRFLSWKRALAGKGLLGMDFLFWDIPKRHVPFDYGTFTANPCRFWIGVTHCESGEASYFEKHELSGIDDFLTILQASSSLPLVSFPVQFGEDVFLDGGLSDPIPLDLCLSRGHDKRVVILTQNAPYRKKASKIIGLCRRFLPQYPRLHTLLARRHEQYNDVLSTVEAMGRRGDVFIIRPSSSPGVGRLCQDANKLYGLYDTGYDTALKCVPALCEYLGRDR